MTKRTRTSGSPQKPPHRSAATTSPKGAERGGIGSPRAEKLTDRQRKFLEVKIQFPWPSSATAARKAGYSEWVARKADRIIVRGSPKVRRILEEWNRREEEKMREYARSLRTR